MATQKCNPSLTMNWDGPGAPHGPRCTCSICKPRMSAETTLTRIKRLRSYAAHARFLAETSDLVGEIERQADIPSPYRYSPTHAVYEWREKHVIIVETSHRCYDVFEVPAARLLHQS